AGAAAELADESVQDRAAVCAAPDIYGASTVARRRLDGADRCGDAGAEPGSRQVRLGRVSERLVVVARAYSRRRADYRCRRLPPRPADADAAGGVHALGYEVTGVIDDRAAVRVPASAFRADASAQVIDDKRRAGTPLMELNGVSLRYGSGPRAVDVLEDVNLTICAGEFVAIVGFSGSGKTSLLSIMAGLIPPTRGSITFLGKTVTGPGPDRGVIFQNYSLMPWLSVRGNIALAV